MATPLLLRQLEECLSVAASIAHDLPHHLGLVDARRDASSPVWFQEFGAELQDTVFLTEELVREMETAQSLTRRLADVVLWRHSATVDDALERALVTLQEMKEHADDQWYVAGRLGIIVAGLQGVRNAVTLWRDESAMVEAIWGVAGEQQAN